MNGKDIQILIGMGIFAGALYGIYNALSLGLGIDAEVKRVGLYFLIAALGGYIITTGVYP